MQENYDLVQKGFRILHPMLAGYIGQEMRSVYKDSWWSEVLYALPDQVRDLPSDGEYAELVDSLDIPNCLRLIDRKWNDVFRTKLSIDYRTWSKELMGVRNKVSHVGQQDLEKRYAERALDTMVLFSGAFNDAETTEDLRALYRTLRYGSEKGSAAVKGNAQPVQTNKETAGVLHRSVGQNLPSWRTVMQPHPDVAEGRYRAAEFAADLAQVSRGEGAFEYRDPVEFFARTYITEGMAGLLTESLQRLEGIGGEPVIQLKTAFGGGKTHSLLALYHMSRGGVPLEKIPLFPYTITRSSGSILFSRPSITDRVRWDMNSRPGAPSTVQTGMQWELTARPKALAMFFSIRRHCVNCTKTRKPVRNIFCCSSTECAMTQS